MWRTAPVRDVPNVLRAAASVEAVLGTAHGVRDERVGERAAATREEGRPVIARGSTAPARSRCRRPVCRTCPARTGRRRSTASDAAGRAGQHAHDQDHDGSSGQEFATLHRSFPRTVVHGFDPFFIAEYGLGWDSVGASQGARSGARVDSSSSSCSPRPGLGNSSAAVGITVGWETGGSPRVQGTGASARSRGPAGIGRGPLGQAHTRAAR